MTSERFIGWGLLGLLLVVGTAITSSSGSSGSSSGPPPPPDPPPEPDPWGTPEDLASRGLEPAGSRAGVDAFRRWALSRGGRDGGIWRDPAVGGASEHHDGRAWDWMIDLTRGRALVEELLADDAALARATGVLYLIHDRKIRRAYPWNGVQRWTPLAYAGRSPHTDHVHLSFTRAGARGETSAYRPGGALAAFVQGANA